MRRATLSAATPKTVEAVVEAARAVEGELADMLSKMGGAKSDAYEALRLALLALDRELLRGDAADEPERGAQQG